MSKRRKGSRPTGRFTLQQYEQEVVNSPLMDVLSVNEIMEEFRVDASTTIIRAIEQLRLPARKMDAEQGAKGGRYIAMRNHVERLWAYRTDEDTI